MERIGEALPCVVSWFRLANHGVVLCADWWEDGFLGSARKPRFLVPLVPSCVNGLPKDEMRRFGSLPSICRAELTVVGIYFAD